MHHLNGNGTITANLTNAGAVNANVANQTLSLSHNMANNNLFEATNGANLAIPLVTITQTGPGQILAAANSTVALNIATINGGILNTSGNRAVNIINTTSATTLSNVTNNGTLNILRNASLTLPAPANNIIYTFDITHDPSYIDLHRGFLGDANDDGTVDLTDLSVILNNFGQIAPSAGNTPLLPAPEPATLAFLLPAALLARIRRTHS